MKAMSREFWRPRGRDDHEYFELNDKEAGDIMTHRTNITALDASMSLDEAVTYILTGGQQFAFPCI